MKKPCSTCPFRKGTKDTGAPDWVMDIMQMRDGAGHTCHQTDPEADMYKAGKPIQCSGFRMMKMNERVGGSAYAEIFKSTKDCVAHHARAFFEEGERRGILKGLAKLALEKIRNGSL